MIAKLLRFALQQRFVTIVLSLALIGLGVWSFLQLKIEAYPDISDTQAVVITLYPGRAAEEVEQQVTVPIERALNSTPNVIARPRPTGTPRRQKSARRRARLRRWGVWLSGC